MRLNLGRLRVNHVGLVLLPKITCKSIATYAFQAIIQIWKGLLNASSVCLVSIMKPMVHHFVEYVIQVHIRVPMPAQLVFYVKQDHTRLAGECQWGVFCVRIITNLLPGPIPLLRHAKTVLREHIKPIIHVVYALEEHIQRR
jgi:hypothetical protein